MNRRTRIACGLLLAIAAVTPQVSLGQAVTPPVVTVQGTGFTADQYRLLGERAAPFCEYLFSLKRDGKPLPSGDVRLPGAGEGYVYTVGEVIALTAKCDAIVPLMQQLAKPVR